VSRWNATPQQSTGTGPGACLPNITTQAGSRVSHTGASVLEMHADRSQRDLSSGTADTAILQSNSLRRRLWRQVLWAALVTRRCLREGQVPAMVIRAPSVVQQPSSAAHHKLVIGAARTVLCQESSSRNQQAGPGGERIGRKPGK
jgi:hypothetical protein